MKLTELIRVTPDYDNQLSFLIKREFYVTYYKYRKLPLLIVGSFILFLVLLFFPGNQFTVGFKTVTVTIFSILLIFSAILGLRYLIKLKKRQNWKSSMVQKFSKETTAVKFGFNSDKLFFETDISKSELKWEYYSYWTEESNSIFIFPANNIYEAIYFSSTELGQDNYDRLKQIASDKLKPLTRKNSTWHMAWH